MSSKSFGSGKPRRRRAGISDRSGVVVPVKLPSGHWMRPHPPRGILDRLTPLQAQRLREWLADPGVSYDLALARLKRRFGLVVSTGALSAWWYRRGQMNGRNLKARQRTILADILIRVLKNSRVTVLVRKPR